jgi:hypothetical protein
MEHILVKVVFGHLFGDFFFQFRKMADNKYLKGQKAYLWCTIHVAVYTLVMALFMWNFSPVFLLGVFIPHWLIDRYSLAYKWMEFHGSAPLIRSKDPKQAAFGSIIYVVLDQSMHAMCLYLLIKYAPI